MIESVHRYFVKKDIDNQFHEITKQDQQDDELIHSYLPKKDQSFSNQKSLSKMQNQSSESSDFAKTIILVIISIFLLGGLAFGFRFLYILFQQAKYKQQIIQRTIFVGINHEIQNTNFVFQDKYFFSLPIKQMLLKSDVSYMFNQQKNQANIAINQYMRAVVRTQLVHNINFQGEIKPELSPFDKGLQEKRKAIREIMRQEEIYYESLYNIKKYMKHQLRFCIVVPSYNNVKSKLYLRNLDSIFMQDYQNYHVIYIDDASPQKTGQYVMAYVQERKIPPQKIQIIINKQKLKALNNIYSGIHQHCPNGQVVVLIDGDDSLIGRKVLQILNSVYQTKKSAMIYTNFLKILPHDETSFGFGSHISKDNYFDGKIRKSAVQMVGSHLMTFFADIFKKIKQQDLCYQNGTFYDYAYDRAIITPMIQMAYPRVQYLPQFTYEYRNDTGMNDGTNDWLRVSQMIIKRPSYTMLGDYSFIDNFVKQKN